MSVLSLHGLYCIQKSNNYHSNPQFAVMKISLYFCCLKNNKLALANFIACLSPLPPRKTDVTLLLSNQSFKGEPRWWVSWIRSIWRASGGTKNTVRGQQKTYTTRIFSGFRGKKPYFHWLKPFLVSLQRLAELLIKKIFKLKLTVTKRGGKFASFSEV